MVCVFSARRYVLKKWMKLMILLIVFLVFTPVNTYAKSNEIHKNVYQNVSIQINTRRTVTGLQYSKKIFSVKKLSPKKYSITPKKIGVYSVVLKTKQKSYNYVLNVRRKTVTKSKTVYIGSSVNIKLNNVRKIKKSNSNVLLKKTKSNTYKITGKKSGNVTVKFVTKLCDYVYNIHVKSKRTMSSESLKSYMNKKNPRRIVFTNKVNKKATRSIFEHGKYVFVWMKGDTLYVSTNGHGKVICDDATFLFASLKNTEYIDVSYLDTSRCSDFIGMFSNSGKLKEIVGLRKLNTINATCFDDMFALCKSLKLIDVSGWRTGSVRSMDSVFDGCENLETIKGLETWNTKNVRTMDCMFSYGVSYSSAGKLRNINLSTWNVSNVITMDDMFYGQGSLEHLDVSRWNPRKLESADHMFCRCVLLKELDVSKWDVSNLKDFNAMFHSCQSLKQIDVSQWNTRSAIYMCQMFETCTSLTNIDVSGFYTEHVLGYGDMFKDCYGLTELDLTSFSSKGVPSGKCIQGEYQYFRCCSGFETMFQNSKNLKHIYVNKKWSIAGKPAEDIFKGCGTNRFEVR